MGIFDFLKSKKEEPKKVKLRFNKLEGWLYEKIKMNKEKEHRILISINSIISETILTLNEQRFMLDKIDLKDRKEEERLKRIVVENISFYSSHLDKLIFNLKNLKKESLEEMLEHLNKIFLDFKQKSNTSFEKSTILVGKELGDIKETITKFSNELNDVLTEDKETLEFFKNLADIFFFLPSNILFCSQSSF